MNGSQTPRLSDDQLRAMIDAIPALVWSCLPDGAAEFVNRRWLEYTGLTEEQLLGWGWKAAVHPEDLGTLMDTWIRLLATGEAGQAEARFRRADGEYRWFLLQAEAVRDERGRVIRWYGTTIDIEDLKRAEKRNQGDRQQIRSILDAMPQFVVVLAPDGTVLYANQAVLDYTGLTMAEAKGEAFRFRVFHAEDVARIEEERQQALRRGTPFELEQRARRKDGEYRWFLVHYKPLLDEHGRALRWYASGIDIHDHKLAEEQARNETLALREEIDRTSMFEEIVGSSAVLRNVLSQVSKVARADSTVLILGETGTGKELIARAIHRRSSRATRAFIRVNCSAIPTSLIASELFGHEKGAFTGAAQRRLGRFEAANGGTIFLDEVGDLPADTQIALLRVLQEREIERVGSNQPIPVDVRVLAATNRDLDAAVATGAFRQDLFYRLNVFPVRVPALRERADDIPLLVEYLIERYVEKAGKRIRQISRRTLELFQSYDWPGNVRELQNVVERAVILCEDGTFSVDETWLRQEPSQGLRAIHPVTGTLAEHDLELARQEREMIEAALVASRGRISGPAGAAARLGVPRQTLDSRIKALQINKYSFKAS
ncbi:MAG TPA: sigma 54-interacting transcriptional regulator [Terriglobales bacterium]|nr:sigma 54-interacting transcriptional regulator [Terriglobales bacterium]